MSSILTNTGAMVALQTLKSVNSSLENVQNEISTGKTVATAKDNAAVWAISKVMESDVAGFEGISDSLGLGESTVAVASSAAETVTDLLIEIEAKIVSAQEDNVDRTLIQDDVEELRDQIASVVGAAQFNGLNLLSNTDLTADSSEVDVLSSLDRSSTGVTASDITVVKQDLTTNASTVATDMGGTMSATNSNTAFSYGDDAEVVMTLTGPAELVAGMSYQVSDYMGTAITADNPQYVAKDGDTLEDATQGLVESLNYFLVKNGQSDFIYSTTDTVGEIAITDVSDDDSVTDLDAIGSIFDIEYSATTTEITGAEASGGLELLADFDVSTEEGAAAALQAITGLIQTSIDAAAAFGSAGGRIETQLEFVSSLTDALESGIGTLVDADMEEASARLQALQVQQQLAVQALSIANEQPQTLLSLFR